MDRHGSVILYLKSFYFHSSLDSRLDSQDLILNSFNTACGHMQAGVWVHEMFIFPALTFQKHSNLVRSNTAAISFAHVVYPKLVGLSLRAKFTPKQEVTWPAFMFMIQSVFRGACCSALSKCTHPTAAIQRM